MESYNDKLNNFKNRISNAEKNPILQEVKVIDSKLHEEVQLNVWVPKELLFLAKQKALNEHSSLKQIVLEALKKHLE